MSFPIKQQTYLGEFFRTRKLVLAAGSDSAGGSWLYETCRLLLSAGKAKSYACSVTELDLRKAEEAEIILLRLDAPDEELAFLAWRVFTVRRDLRDIWRSEKGISTGDEAGPSQFEVLGRYIRDHGFWSARAHLDLAYEDIAADPGEALRAIAHQIGQPVAPSLEQDVLRDLESAKVGRDSDAGGDSGEDRSSRSPLNGWLHGRQGMIETYMDAEIEGTFGSWLREFGYPVSGWSDREAGRRSRTRVTPVRAPDRTYESEDLRKWIDDDLTRRRVLVLYDPQTSGAYQAFSHLANLHGQLSGAGSVESFVFGTSAGPKLPPGVRALKVGKLDPHRRDNRLIRRLLALLRKTPSIFSWFSNVDGRREAAIELFRHSQSPWTDAVLFVADVEFGVNLIELMFLFLAQLPQRVVIVLPVSTDAPRAALERLRSFGVRVLFDGSDFEQPTMRFLSSGMIRCFDADDESPLHPRKAPMIDWRYELAAARFRESRPEVILFLRPDWAKCGSATTFSKLSRVFRGRGAVCVDVALQPWRMHRDLNFVRERLTEVSNDLHPALHFHLGRWWPIERGAQLSLAWRRWRLKPQTTAAYVALFYSQCVTPRWLRKCLQTAHVDYVYVNHYFSLPVAKRLRGDLPVLVDTHDIQSTNFVAHRYHEWLGGPPASFRDNLRDEFAIVRQATMVTMVSEDEINVVRNQLPGLEIFHYIPVPTVNENPASGREHEARLDGVKFLIVASRNPANERSLSWFFKCVWPDVHSPHVTLDVVGGIDGYFAGESFPRVRFLGMVDDLGGAYREADVIVLPVTNGGGIAIKTLEAIQYEKPIVATNHAFRGLPADVKEGMSLCSDETDMIEDLVQLALSRDDRLVRQRFISELKRRLAAKHYDAVLEQHLDQLRCAHMDESILPTPRAAAHRVAAPCDAASIERS